MRLRHIKGCEEYISKAKDCLNTEDAIRYRGAWNTLFGNTNPIQIEIGMGKGQFIRTMADKYKDINFIGIERYESVLMKALQRKYQIEALEGKYKNLYFACFDALLLGEVFDRGEVDKIYLNFSDPWPKARHKNRRLTSERFLGIYNKILKPTGVIEFKTDNIELFDYSLESITEAGWKILYSTRDLHSETDARDNIMSEYEEKFSAKGQAICKLVAGR